jgi:Xaa-Pro aminopeptidase
MNPVNRGCCNRLNIQEMRKAIRDEGLDGWLFCNFRHRDRLADEILGLDPAFTNSRLWLYAIPASGEALGFVHAVEQDALDRGAGILPGKRISYRGRDELIEKLGVLAGKRWGCHFSPNIPAVSFLDAGTAAMLAEAGLELASAEGLLQRFRGLLDGDALAAHERAAVHLYEIVETAWDKTRRSFEQGLPLREGDIQALMLKEFQKRNLITDHPPIAAAGPNSANPHYDIARNDAHNAAGALIAPGDIIQFDLWARDPGPLGIYADISWVGVFGKEAPAGAEAAFADLVQAREGVFRFIEEELAAGRRPRGADVDRKARDILTGFGYGDVMRHRTGHGIDSEVHGSGVNMDSVEFPDERLLLDGSCFSLEPGIYFSDFGLRTEVDVYIKNGKPYISGKERQFTLLHC